MKLKKIASLALAGVMAVSMLAGCANKPGTTDDNQGTQTVSVADALNANLSADNQKKVTFTDDASLATALEKAIEKLGASTGTATGNTTTTDTNLLKEVAKTIGAGADISYDKDNSKTTITVNDYTAMTGKDSTDAVTVLKLYRIAAGDDNLNMEKYLVNQLVDKVDPDLDSLKLTTKEGKNPGDTYYDYSYTGKATVLVQKADNGAIYYLVLTSVTRTGTEAKLPEA